MRKGLVNCLRDIAGLWLSLCWSFQGKKGVSLQHHLKIAILMGIKGKLMFLVIWELRESRMIWIVALFSSQCRNMRKKISKVEGTKEAISAEFGAGAESRTLATAGRQTHHICHTTRSQHSFHLWPSSQKWAISSMDWGTPCRSCSAMWELLPWLLQAPPASPPAAEVAAQTPTPKNYI